MIMGVKVIRTILSSLLLLTIVFAGVGHAKEPIRIGTTQSLTGHYSDQGAEQLRGLQMWAADVNSRGALLGRPVEIVHYDDGSRDAGTVEGFTRLLEEDGVDLLVGPYSSSLTLKASLVAEEHNVPMVTTAASSEEIWNRGLKNVFGVDTPARDYVEGIRVGRDAGAKTIAMVYAKTEFGEEVAAAMREGITTELVFDEGYAPQERDFEAIANRLRDVNADIVFGVSYLDDSIAMVRALNNAGVRPKMLGFTIGPGQREFGKQLGDDAQGILGVVQWLRSSRQPGAQDFAHRYNRRYGENPGVYAVIGYSAGQVLEAAVRLAGTTDHDAVREQLATMYFRAMIGPYHVDENGRQKNRKNFVLQWQDDSRRLIAPANMAERELIYPRR